jgi:predicted nucleic acid-binding protein
MSIYLDTSVLVSIYIPEKHSKSILQFLQNTQDRPYLSRLTETEFYATLARKKRTKELTQTAINTITTLFRHHLTQLAYEKIYITDAVFETAIHFLTNYSTDLRTLDALHLACSANIHATLITADKVLAKSAQQLNIPTQLL